MDCRGVSAFTRVFDAMPGNDRLQRDHICMTDLLLRLASPEFWRDCGSALVALGVIGVASVIFLPDAKRGLQKGLALLFIAALLAEARERASVAEFELTRLTTPRTLAP